MPDREAWLADTLVLSQRGASGIDGLIAGAAGAASAFDGPVTLLMGDVSALHDVSGLAVAGSARRSLAVVGPGQSTPGPRRGKVAAGSL